VAHAQDKVLKNQEQDSQEAEGDSNEASLGEVCSQGRIAQIPHAPPCKTLEMFDHLLKAVETGCGDVPQELVQVSACLDVGCCRA
jgi:hypothetical protein